MISMKVIGVSAVLILLVVIILFVVLKVQSGDSNADIEGFRGLISSEGFAQKMSEGEYIVLDVRTPEEYFEQRIGEDALLVNFYDDDFRAQLNVLDKNAKYLMHCRSGGRSANAAAIMSELGFTEFYELEGGINAWNESEFPTFSN